MQADVQLLNIPNEILFNILLNLNTQSLISLCKSNQYVRSICDDEYFWSIKFVTDFPFVDPPLTNDNEEIEWKNSYIEVFGSTNPLKVCFDIGPDIYIQRSTYFTPKYYITELLPYVGDTYIAIFGTKIGYLDPNTSYVYPNFVYIDGYTYNFLNVFGNKIPEVVYIIQGSLYDQIKSIITEDGIYVIDTERGLHNDAIINYAAQRNILINDPNTTKFAAVKHRYLLDIRSLFSEKLGQLLRSLPCTE